MDASKIINSARLSLGDSKAQRWSDDRLVNLVDEAQNDICLNTHMHRSYAYIPLVEGQYKYDLPNDFLILHRVQDGNKKVPMKTRDYLDQKSLDWRDVSGNAIECVLKDSLPMGQVEIYPKPTDDLGYVPTYRGTTEDPATEFILEDHLGVWSDSHLDDQRIHLVSLVGAYSNLVFTIDDYDDLEETYWGILTDIYTVGDNDIGDPEPAEGVTANIEMVELEDEDLFGVLIDVDPVYAEIDTGWGAVTSVLTDGTILKVLYTATPPEVTNVNSPLILANVWATALKYYVAGYALMDDNEAGNQQRGQSFLQRYSRELAKASELSTTEQTDASEASQVGYQTPFRRT